MCILFSNTSSAAVALPTEGVDRNLDLVAQRVDDVGVALPTEGVDRNRPSMRFCLSCARRPPHGGRG